MELLTLNELKEAIQNGDINDYTPYIENDYKYRRFLLSQGICVDEILNYQDYPLLLDVINRGEYTEYYEQWTKSFVSVRQALSGRGYFPEIFVKDKNPEVRLNVLRCHPEYTLELLKDPDLVTKVEDYLVKQHQPSMNALKYYMNIITPQHENYQPAKLKRNSNEWDKLNHLNNNDDVSIVPRKQPGMGQRLYNSTSEASPTKLRLDGASIVRFCGFSFFLMIDFLLSPYDLSLSSCS